VLLYSSVGCTKPVNNLVNISLWIINNWLAFTAISVAMQMELKLVVYGNAQVFVL